MPRTDDGAVRYPKRSPQRQPDMIVAGRNLGPALKPQDVFIWLKLLLELEPDEILEAFARADAGRLAQAYPELTDLEIGAMISGAAEVTPSRIDAWRRRNREMTWLELRTLLAGLRGSV